MPFKGFSASAWDVELAQGRDFATWPVPFQTLTAPRQAFRFQTVMAVPFEKGTQSAL
jgi:hypothetical protein